MARLSKAQAQARRQIIDLSGRTLPVDRLGRAIVDALAVAIPHDGYRLLGIDPTTTLINRVIAASENDGWARSEWLREIYLRAEALTYIEIPEMMRLGLCAIAMHERQQDCWGIPSEVLARIEPRVHRATFHDLRSPVGGTLFGCFASRGQWVAALQLYRRDTGRPFRPTDVAFLRMMGPAIGGAIATARLLASDRSEANGVASPSASGVIMLDGYGRQAFQTPAAEVWCEALEDEPDQLPSAVLAAAARARASMSGVGVVLADTDFGPVRVEASGAGADGSLAVIIAPRLQAPGPAVPYVWGLTPAEQRVVALALRGLSNDAIASRLFVTDETVRTHLRHVYAKLDIRGRNQLLARYFDATFERVDVGVVIT